MTEPTMPELLPCPFCGGEGALAETEGSQSVNFDTVYRPYCPTHHCTDFPWSDRQDAITAWNRRALPAALRAALRAARAEGIEAAARTADASAVAAGKVYAADDRFRNIAREVSLNIARAIRALPTKESDE